MTKRSPRLLGFHGLTFRSPDPEKLAARWRALTGLPVLRRSRVEIVLGHGPELFIAVRRGRAFGGERLEEAHLAVKEIAETRTRAAPDALGGDSWRRDAGTVRVVGRQFRRPPSGGWRKKRKRTSD